ncbi:sugar transporter SWEET1 isoform X2 [Parus major]|uniref:sugar transporter SWEET1 isoform X2 n=1 Tax=Parus major TaxID=9157 RepID=UPI00077113E2|nr:sugar transporter SWEET1 isoform X2 [Parus major]
MVLSVLAGVCLAATLAMFATGLSDLRQMLATKSVENIQFLPFLTTDANNLSWLGYGCLKGDGTVITVNAIGAVLQTLYILVYLYYSPAKRPVLLQVLLLLALVVTGYGYFTILVDTGTRLTHLGLFCSIFTITMYLSPLADLAKVVRSKSTRCLSFPLTVTTLVASSSWTLYGLQLHDPYITVGWGGGTPRGVVPSHSIPSLIMSHPHPTLACFIRIPPFSIPFCCVPLLPHFTPSHSYLTPPPSHPIPSPSRSTPSYPIPPHSPLHGSAEHLAWGRPCSAPHVSPSQG